MLSIVVKWIVVPLSVCILVSVLIGQFTKTTDDDRPAMVAIAMKDGWWGKGSPNSTADSKAREITITVSDKILSDLKMRLEMTRFHPGLPGVGFQYGFNVDYMKMVVQYWKTKFDWKKQEGILNQYKHYKMSIEGIDVHYVHVRAKEWANNRRALLMIHGWPGSFYEFYKIIPMLNADQFAFDIICPSIPGYGFSDIPLQPGFDILSAARVFHKLMQNLGYKQFYIQGGDWGSIIASNMALLKPSNVIGIHMNMIAVQDQYSTMKMLLGTIYPPLVVSESDSWKLYPLFERLKYIAQEMGYFLLQSTKPDSVGFALNNSPVGLAAYILEKFSTWTNPAFRLSENGNLTDHFTLDELLTNIMIYWSTGTITSSMRFYKESNWGPSLDLHQRFVSYPVEVPTGLACYPYELFMFPENFVHARFPKLVQYTDMPSGGHFPAFENPQQLAKDFLSFVRKVEQS